MSVRHPVAQNRGGYTLLVEPAGNLYPLMVEAYGSVSASRTDYYGLSGSRFRVGGKEQVVGLCRIEGNVIRISGLRGRKSVTVRSTFGVERFGCRHLRTARAENTGQKKRKDQQESIHPLLSETGLLTDFVEPAAE